VSNSLTIRRFGPPDVQVSGAGRRRATGATDEAPAPTGPQAPTAPKVADVADEGNGDLRRRGARVLSPREASPWTRRYLSAVGLPLPADARLVRDIEHDFNYDCSGGPNGPNGTQGRQGTRRMLRVRVNPKDGSLEHLHNVVYRKYPDVSATP